jgi:hypothetical protein
MKPLWYLWAPLTLALASSSCGAPANSQSAPVSEVQPTPGRTQPEEYPEPIDNIFVDGDSLSYDGFEIVKLEKKVKYYYPPEMKSPPDLLDASYAVLKKNGRVVAKFDGVYHGMGNTTDFGLFPFLGGGAKQLAVSLTIPRGGRHWVVGLSSAARVIFDSGDYGVGREEFSVIIDIDKDGVYEISLPLTEFYMFESMNTAETPLPEIVFKYDGKARKYLPANPSFQSYVLRGIEDEVSRLRPGEGNSYISERLDILLRYIYAGKEEVGWDFFDREYRLPDKEQMKSKVKAVLRNEGAYKYIYGKHAT